jgi:site-specific recombinase XerD
MSEKNKDNIGIEQDNIHNKVKDSFKKITKVFSTEQLIELIQLSKSGPNGLRNHCMIVLLATTGIRIEELRNLKISDFNSDLQLIQIRSRKTNNRKIKISSFMGEIIKNYIDFTFGTDKNNLSEIQYFHLKMEIHLYHPG